ncbi:hypothetical protein ACSSS7_002055 [Eimeria intestinalis]
MVFAVSSGHGLTSLVGRSLLSAPTKVTAHAKAWPQVQKRHLGNEARGPDFDPFSTATWRLRPHVEVLYRSLSHSALSYNEFKQFCESLRLLLFVGGSAVIATNMLLRAPTQSAYWRLFSPLKWPGLLLSPFRGAKGTGGVFDFDERGLTQQSDDGTVKTAAYTAFERAMK